ncbi:unnamed protein product [Dibothriocephalus latus]|uniref:BPTI/Kunitz inhibitor domain-containing protein n=1 Tax=Dibothriocephalus latus TaxID=60516 RepID=A0A3P6QDB1_DIBLA|nr:unnamed protein product [Dibothriocephalus latus]
MIALIFTACLLAVVEGLTNDCHLKPDPGPCKGFYQRFAYNRKNNTCVPFIYGGCQGNGNNFETKKQCEKKCLGKSSTRTIQFIINKRLKV